MSRHVISADAVITGQGRVGDAIVVDGGRVVEVTSRDSLDLQPAAHHAGHVILPAFIDSHVHPLGYASLITGTSLKEATSFPELADRLRGAADRLATGEALVAQRVDDTGLGRLPTRLDLDSAVTDRPVLIYRYCGHIAVANTVALDLAGIDRDTPDPPGGSLDRDADGTPTGVLRETAVELVGDAVDPFTPAPTDAAVLAALEGLAATGIARLGGMVAASRPLWCGVGDELGTLCRLAGDLPLDIDVMVIAESMADLRAATRKVTESGGRLRFWGWKGFADGSLGGHTAAMWAPFVDEPTTGTLRLNGGDAAGLAATALEMGGVAAIHAIGDRAVDATLDLFDRLIDEGHEPERMRIEHLSVASDEAIGRLAESRVIASVQPAFLSSEGGWVPERLGSERAAYRFAVMHRAGVRMIGGSDCPVEPPDPLHGIHSAVQRPGWDDNEHLTVEEAVALFTTTPSRHFGVAAPLAAGSPADFVVVDGEVGSGHASVEAVYRRGEKQSFQGVRWPG